MRKIIAFSMISIDGYFARKNGDIDWHTVDDEFNKFAIEHTASFGTMIFGHTTYKLFESYWPEALKDPKTGDDDRKIAQIIEDATKIVFSTKLKEASWSNTKIFDKITPEKINEWKSKEGKDAVIFGSGQIVRSLARLGLIDEYRLMVAPIVLGEGMHFFEGREIKMDLIGTRTFGNGNVLLFYKPLSD